MQLFGKRFSSERELLDKLRGFLNSLAGAPQSTHLQINTLAWAPSARERDLINEEEHDCSQNLLLKPNSNPPFANLLVILDIDHLP
jgi:hypothetical protein